MKPYDHALKSVERYGGKPEDYLPIHDLLDSTKSTFCNKLHRAIAHNSWFIGPNGPLELIFGKTITNSYGKIVNVRDVGEDHISEDFNGFVPSVQDWLQNLPMEGWMDNGKVKPESYPNLNKINHGLDIVCDGSAGYRPKLYSMFDSSGKFCGYTQNKRDSDEFILREFTAVSD